MRDKASFERAREEPEKRTVTGVDAGACLEVGQSRAVDVHQPSEILRRDFLAALRLDAPTEPAAGFHDEIPAPSVVRQADGQMVEAQY